MSTSSENTTQQWLESLYGKSPGWFTVIIFKEGKPYTKWFNTGDIDRVAPAIQKAAEEFDVYCSVATYKTKPDKGRGSLKDVQSIPGFWADLDIGQEGHKPAQRPNPETIEQALDIISELPSPTAIIHSGGGLQVWWLFEEPWVFENPKDAQQSSNEFQARLKSSAESLGYHVDSVGDLPRILRVPGTKNHKTGNPRPVTLQEFSGQRYSAAELTALGEVREDEVPPKGFNTWEEILEPHGWTKAGVRHEDGATLWVRPGKSASEGHSAVTDPYGVPVMVNFSGSTDLPTGPAQRLTKFKVWAYLNFGGDLDRAKQSAEHTINLDPDVVHKRAQRFQRLVWAQVFTLAEEPVEWLVEPLIEKGTQVAIYSEAKAGKSLIMLEVAARLASGWSQFTWPPTKDKEKHRVCYVDMENRPYDIGERLIKMGFVPEDLDELYYFSFPSIGHLDTKKGAEDLLAIALDNNVECVIIDTLSRVVEGAENDNDTYIRFFDHTGMALKQHGIAMVRLDHSGKDSGKGMRGASAKTTDVDAVWELTVDEERIILRRTYDRNAHGNGYLELSRRDMPHLHHSAELFSPEELMESVEDRQLNAETEALRTLRSMGVKRNTTSKQLEQIWADKFDDVLPPLVKATQYKRYKNQISIKEEKARCANTQNSTRNDLHSGAEGLIASAL